MRDAEPQELLRDVMRSTGTSQTRLARMSGVRQPSISQYLSGSTTASDAQLDRLLSCMGHRLEVSRAATTPTLTRSERRSWLLHRAIAELLGDTLPIEWTSKLATNIERLRTSTRGQPHSRNIDRWEQMIDRDDLPHIHRALTGLSRDAIELREVSPFSGLLPDGLRLELIKELRADAS